MRPSQGFKVRQEQAKTWDRIIEKDTLHKGGNGAQESGGGGGRSCGWRGIVCLDEN